MANQINNRNNGNTGNKAASTVFQVGDFISDNGSGQLIPSTGLDQILGISNEAVATTDADYATVRQLNFSESVYNDEFEIPVITGTATSALEWTYVDVDPSDPRGVDVTASVAKQILVTKVINASLIQGKIAQCCISSS